MPKNLIRSVTTATVLAVAVVAALISYWHAVHIVAAHGETGLTSYLYPVTIDGLVICSSMSLLSAARSREAGRHVLACTLFWSGIAATVGINGLCGIGHGPVGLMLAAWPALAMAGSFELLLRMIRTTAEQHETDATPLFVQARTAFPDSRNGASLPSLASIRRTLSVTDRQARVVREYLAAR
jgi:hypothetical protein